MSFVGADGFGGPGGVRRIPSGGLKGGLDVGGLPWYVGLSVFFFFGGGVVF